MTKIGTKLRAECSKVKEFVKRYPMYLGEHKKVLKEAQKKFEKTQQVIEENMEDLDKIYGLEDVKDNLNVIL